MNAVKPHYEPIVPNNNDEILCDTTHSTGNITPLHWHEAMEIIFLKSGDLSFTLNGSEHSLPPGSFILVNTSVFHATASKNGNEALVILLPDAFLEKNIPNYKNTFIHFETSTELSDLLLTIYRLQSEQERGYSLKVKSLVYDLLYILYCNYSYETTPAPKNQKDISVLKDILTYTDEHYSTSITIEEIAGVAGFQPKYFCRFFKKQMNQTYLEYLNSLRFSLVFRDMIATGSSITSLLEKHGYTNYRHFSTHFKKSFHTTPAAFRKDRIRKE